MSLRRCLRNAFVGPSSVEEKYLESVMVLATLNNVIVLNPLMSEAKMCVRGRVMINVIVYVLTSTLRSHTYIYIHA